MIKRMLEKFKQVNREYLLLFFVVMVVAVMIYSTTAQSQTPEAMTFTTFYPCPFGEFDTVSARRFVSFQNSERDLDPNGVSRLQSLHVFGAIITGIIKADGSPFFVNFGDGQAVLGSVVADRIEMGDPGPPTSRLVGGDGKYVYDIAEGMDIADCEAGDVVIIDGQKDMGLVKSTVKFDYRVAGIVSTDPKIYMGSGEDKMPLALAGIVKCKSNNENGQIKRGDLLVTSSMPGYAMRADAKQVKPGMLIGKALEPLSENSGKIFVLVNKQ